MTSGWIVTCVGSLTRYSLRLADTPGVRVREGKWEIVSLVGTLTAKGDSHLHMSLSDGRERMFGGHVLYGCKVYTTAEIVIGEPRDLEFIRVRDEVLPWNELRILKKKS